MRKIIACEWLSLDGFFSGINGETDWFYWDKEIESYFKNFQRASIHYYLDGLLMTS
jgi:hypothetical protein